MNARKAVLADNPELILRVLQLRFDESLSYPRISAQTGVSKTAIFSLVRRFHQVFTDWPLSGEYSCGLLAHVVTGKYADHLPLYRQSEIYRRQGVELSRATLGRWTGAVAELLEPLYDVLRQYVLMPGEKSTMCMQERPPTSPRKPCSVSVNCMPSRQRSGAVQQNSVWRQEKPEPRH